MKAHNGIQYRATMNHRKICKLLRYAITLTFISGCDTTDPALTDTLPEASISNQTIVTLPTKQADCDDQYPYRQALFGDLHVHTTYSFDVFSFGVTTTPEQAYRFAKGESIDYLPVNETGEMEGTIRIDRPLDFMAVTDHAEFLGEYQLCMSSGSADYNSAYCEDLRKGGRAAIMATGALLALDQPQRIAEFCTDDNEKCVTASAQLWQKIITAAENAHDDSSDCSFTALVGYEYTGTPSTSNYHRNVIFRSTGVPAIPVSYFEAPHDYQLWKTLDDKCDKIPGCEYLTIPHNSNLSNGKLLVPYANLPDTTENKIEYANTRLAREPLMEIFQHKGNSECSNGFPGILGAPDELCNVEQFRQFGNTGKSSRVRYNDKKITFEQPIENPTTLCPPGKTGFGGMSGSGNGCISENDFYRSALLNGLKQENDIGLNPIKLGATASTDTHMATAGATREDLWRGHIASEWNKEGRLTKPTLIPSGVLSNPGGLTGVWAIENSRDGIFDAMLRREVYGTSGTRIKPRFFAAWSYPDDICTDTDMLAKAYKLGVPMGADLGPSPANKPAPTFILSALADPAVHAAPLQKLQLIKGWITDDGTAHNKVYDVAGDAETDAGVNLESGKRYGKGYASLCVVFTDPDYDATENAYYYMRAVENPTPRWSMIDCLNYDQGQRPELCSDPGVFTTINEQAWTSPIWVNSH
jgi:hypothetical protein